eukprot:3402146-Pyramimonas_sp.AAC.1
MRPMTLGAHSRITIGPVYGVDSIGPKGENLELLEFLSALLGAQRFPFLLGGDWNLEPEEIMELGWLDLATATIFAHGLPTCNEKEYDYFIGPQALDAFPMTVEARVDAPISPHCY